jgi:hypothetical protein
MFESAFAWLFKEKKNANADRIQSQNTLGAYFEAVRLLQKRGMCLARIAHLVEDGITLTNNDDYYRELVAAVQKVVRQRDALLAERKIIDKFLEDMEER